MRSLHMARRPVSRLLAIRDLAVAGNRGLLAADGKPEHLNSRKPGC
jgi:hypothetical protein